MDSPGPVFPENLFHYAVIITDMWDSHVCPPARHRVEQLVARVADLIGNARRRGALIVHAPSGYSTFYENTGSAARQRALAAPRATLPASPAPVYPSRDQEPIVVDENKDGACDEERDWSKAPTRQHSAIWVDESRDAIIDDGEHQLLFNLLKHSACTRVLILGVHVNMCILERSFAIPRLVAWKAAGALESVALVRDLTDAMYSSRFPPYVNHYVATDLMVQYIKNTYPTCSTVLSSDLLGGQPFRFAADQRPLLHEEWEKHQRHYPNHRQGIRVQIKCMGAGPCWLQTDGATVKLVESQDTTIFWTVTPLGASLYAFAIPNKDPDLPSRCLGGDPDAGTVLMESNTTDHSAGKHWWYLETTETGGTGVYVLHCCGPTAGKKRYLNGNAGKLTMTDVTYGDPGTYWEIAPYEY